MNLVKLLRPHFSQSSQMRGAQYAAMNRVLIRERSESRISAQVRGTRRYDVDLSSDGSVLHVSCSCPHFDEGNPCKHLWATAVVASADPSLADWEGLRAEDVEFDFDDGFDLEDLDELLGAGARATAFPPPGAVPGAVPGGRRAPHGRSAAPPEEPWRAAMQVLRSSLALRTNPYAADPRDDDPAGLAAGSILFLIDPAGALAQTELRVDLVKRVRKKNGEWAKPKALRLERRAVDGIADPIVRRALAVLVGGRDARYAIAGYGHLDPVPSRFGLGAELGALVLPELCRAGSCVLGAANEVPAPLAWDEGEPWRFELSLAKDRADLASGADGWWFTGGFHRGDERVPVSRPRVVSRDFLVIDDRISRLVADGDAGWIDQMRKVAGVAVPTGDADRFLELLFTLPGLPPIDVPPELGVVIDDAVPTCCLTLDSPKRSQSRAVPANLSFDYAGTVVRPAAIGSAAFDAATRRVIRRDHRREGEARATLQRLGFQPHFAGWGSAYDSGKLAIEPERLPGAVRRLVEGGWRVMGDGKVYRPFTAGSVTVRSGIDWFELRGDVAFGDQVAHAPELLAALARGERLVALGDGSIGIVPEEWLRRFAGIAGFGEAKGDHVRFRPTQAALLDALLAAQPDVDVDAGFERARARLKTFSEVLPVSAPDSFVGALRGYQEEGLGWLQFLRLFGFGGCLADDMGLGKTVMVLALLESVRSPVAGAADGAGAKRPSIVVAPKSVVFNWLREAERFAPGLRVVDYTGTGRGGAHARLDSADLVVTSYGTLRQDAVLLEDVEFEYVILDEAQAIKNAGTASAKAARLLRGRHRLALSGTPIENHVGELWSIFEFLNPGMLGSGAMFKAGAALRSGAGEEEVRALGAAVRPFILRRTKSQVAKDLPARQEETLWCELSPRERKLYDQLRSHYRAALLGKIEKSGGGMGRAKLQVLEALLRLRQAACHPGLIDPLKTADGSAKLDVLVEQLGEVLEEGHKAIVFSQFTSLLSLVRRRLDGARTGYLYLDGQTRDRESLVRRFQEGEDPRLFLISLKAGGLGLNLTAADYVYLLDPWWNPAAEARAIDRAHRIGQTRPVFAYRLIARDTVEERILELQQQKRQLADAIITEDNSVIANLTREELERLLG